ncbi:Histone-lysine N-methyltransferase [Phytophthora cinnamomi]|uniref:Histone-lysine N-methyltransferase n=1 Tax=Phytophthora cinnamomi TaxID=4785 RepID=UPI003559D10C|nr:Histone-lysine N-methyltransferase [Phytophthora cinnamomi]
MVGISLAELPPEELHAGDTIAYFSWAFVCGDPRGYRESVVLSVDPRNDEDKPIQVDTDEVIPLTMKIKRLVDRNGHRCTEDEAKWRNLRSFRLVISTCNAPRRSSSFNRAMRRAVDGAFASVMRQSDGECEHPVEVPAAGSPSQAEEKEEEVSASSAAEALLPKVSNREEAVATPGAAVACERFGNAAMNVEVINVETDEDEEASSTTSVARSQGNYVRDDSDVGQKGGATEEMPVKPPTDSDLAAMDAYLKSIPTRWERAKIRHQPKKRAGSWYVARSRKRCNQSKCGITRSGMQIYHAKSLVATKTKAMLRLPGIKARLRALHVRRPEFIEPSAPAEPVDAEAPWPHTVAYTETCEVPEEIAFEDIGDGHPCNCVGDCFMDTCRNATLAIFCTPDCCSLKAACSNAPRTRKTLKLYDTGRVGLGVFTTTFLDVGDVIGEYSGRLCAYPALVKGQPTEAKKQNSGYTMLLNERSVDGKFVYIEALECGSITRFISHACDPNVAFVEMQNRSTVKVMAVMIKSVNAGAQLTVNYGNQIWFKCACDDCWVEETSDGEANLTGKPVATDSQIQESMFKGPYPTAEHSDDLLKGFVVRCVGSMIGTDPILYRATETGKKLGGLKKSDVAFHGIQEFQI